MGKPWRRPASRFWGELFGEPAPGRRSARPALEHLEERTVLSGVQPTYRLLASPSGVTPFSSPSPTGYTPAQIRQAYGFNQIQFGGVTGDGSGQTIAIVDAYDDPNIQSDLNAFSTEFGLPTTSSGLFTFTKVNETGGTTLPAGNTSWAVEISLDVEWAHAIAPRANILLVEASDNSDASIYTAIDTAANTPGVSVVSMSFGESESASETGLDQNFVTPAGHAPVSFVASAGDAGAPPEYPSASPNVLAVGGTTLSVDSAGDYLGESAWSDGGGGISAYEPQPAYQKGVVTQSSTRRTTPDVSYDANPSTGFPVYDSYTYGMLRPWQQVGGTSAGAPQWSALVAIADQGRALLGEQPLDGPSQLLPMIYGLPSADLHDVTSGTTEGNPPESAGPGYDLATGRGSPVANLVVSALAGTTSPAPASTSTTLTSSVNPTAFGESVTFTAQVSSSGGTPAGSVTFMDGSSTLGTETLSSGTATFTTSALPPGGDSITAVYGGNASFASSTSAPLIQTVVDSATTVGLSSSLDPSTAGQSVTFTATVTASPPGSGTPTGTVTFLDGSTTLGTSTLSGGVATFSSATLPTGSDSITAVYSGDSDFTTSTSPALTQTVNPVVNSTTTALASSADPSVFGQPVTFTATVTSPGGTPTGGVTFMDGNSLLGTVPLSGGVAMFTASALPTGGNSITAAYGGSSSFSTSTSSALPQTVNASGSAVALASSLNPSTAGQSVSFTATVTATAPGSGTPGGTVTFLDGSTTLGTGTLSGGVATFSTTTLPVGSDSITAEYSGDGNFTTSTSAALTQTVNPAVNVPTTTTLVSGVNPSVYGQSVTFTATVTGSGGTPTGSVVFMEGTTALATEALSGGTASFSTSALTAGTTSLTAVYSGDSTFAGSTSTSLTQAVNKATTTAQLTVSPSPAALGQTVTLTATLSVVAPGGGIPGGTVTFLDGSTTLGMVRMTNGVATLQISTLAAGTHSLTAVWHGDSNNIGSTSPAVSETISSSGKTQSTTTLTSSADPSAFGQSVTFTATVTGSGGTPTGTVTFLNGTTTLGSGTLSNGTATFTTSSLASGTYSITAVYGGDTTFAGSASAVLTQSVAQPSQAASTTTLAGGTTGPSVYGQSLTFTATVTGSSGTPTGTVTFMSGSTTLSTKTLSGGTATWTTTTLSAGTTNITAVYSGSTAYAGSTSGVVTQTVTKANTTDQLTVSPSPATAGQTVTLTATLATVAPGGGTPGGTVTFMDGTTTLGTARLTNGVATFQTTALAVGTHSLYAVWHGDSNNNGSTSSTVSETINAVGSSVAAPFVSDRGGVNVSAADAVWIELQVEEVLASEWLGRLAGK